jgi:threonine dehydratase
MTVTIDDIRLAADEIRGEIVETPTTFSRALSEVTGAHVVLKFENLQFTASFKDRGALVKMQALGPDERRRGVIAMSAGNHAQAVAYRAQRLGIKSVIVMPRFTPTVKVERTRRFGAEVIIEGDGLDDAGVHAQRLAQERGLHLVHPYDDERIITGQGTVALEILAEEPKLDALLVPVGGGGLIAGVAVAAKAIRPDLEVVGVEASRFPSMRQALDGVPITCGASSMAEGIAVKVPGRLTLPIVRQLVDDVLLVDEDDIEEAVLLLLEVEKAVVEGAGAAGLAALLKHRARFAGRRVGVILSGGNIDLMILSSVIQRGLVRTGRIVRLLVEIRDVPGALAEVTRILGGADANILEARHQRAFTTMGPRSVEVELVLQTRGSDHIQQIVGALGAAGHTPRIPPGEGPLSKTRTAPAIGLGS